MDLDVDLSAAITFLTHVAPAIQAVIIVSLALWFGLNRLISWMDKKEKSKQRDAENEAKDKRAQDFKKLLTDVTTEMKTTAATSILVVKEVTEKLEVLGHEVRSMGDTMKDLRDRQAQVISKSASLAIIETKFEFIRGEVIAIFDQSLRRNNFLERKVYITDRVRMALGYVVNTAEKSLHEDYPGLDADLDPWFERRGSGAGSHRYTLIDKCWEAVVPLYELATPVDQRVEDMRVIITTILNDHIQSCRNTVTDLYAHEESLSSGA